VIGASKFDVIIKEKAEEEAIGFRHNFISLVDPKDEARETKVISLAKSPYTHPVHFHLAKTFDDDEEFSSLVVWVEHSFTRRDEVLLEHFGIFLLGLDT